jgi:signal transduction histidine kinase
MDCNGKGQSELTEQESASQLHKLVARLQSIREDERTRVARHLHDELGQALTALRMNLCWIASRLPDPNEPVAARVRDSIDLADQTILAVRLVATELRPGVLDLGLLAAIEWQCEEFQTRSEIHCEMDVGADCDLLEKLDSCRATVIFRIFQEILTNIARHAQATSVQVSLEQLEDELLLRVCDNGNGIKVDRVSDHNSLGLLEMRERAALIGGQMWIGPAPQRGTLVRIVIPVRIDDNCVETPVLL